MATSKRIITLAAVLCLGAAAQGCYAWPDYYGPYYDYGYGPPTCTYWGYRPTWGYRSRCYSPGPRHRWAPNPGRYDPGHWGRQGSWGRSQRWGSGGHAPSGRSWPRR